MRLSLALVLFCAISLSVNAQLSDCQINSYNTSVNLAGNKLIKHTEIELQINNAQGTGNAEIKIPYTKGNPIKDLKAGIYDVLGNKVRGLKNKDVTKANAFSYSQFHGDDMICSFKLIHNRYPYVIKYSFTEETHDYLYLAYWFPRKYKKVPVKKARLMVKVPEEYRFKKFLLGVDSAKVVTEEGKTTYEWEADDVAYSAREAYGPQLKELLSQVVLIPETFRYGLTGNTKSWKDFGVWLTKLNANLHNLTDAEKVKIDALTSNCQSDLEKVQVLYQYLQDNTRYINVALDIGGLQTKDAKYVCTNKYGDCKALTNYMQAMLAYVGIKSIYTVVYAGHQPIQIHQEYPSQQFNHVILSVPMAKDTLWLECTDKTSPFNYLGTFTQNRPALLVDGEQSRLIQTPALSIDDVLSNYSTTVKVKGNGEATMEAAIRLRGRWFDYMRGLDTSLPERDKLEYIEYLELFENGDIKSFELLRGNRQEKALDLKVNAALNDAVENIGSRLLIKPIRPFYFTLDKPEQRKQEVRFNYPYNVNDTIIYHLPRRVEDVSGIKSKEIISDYGSYKREVLFHDKELKIIRHIKINSAFYQLSKYEGLYAFLQACKREELQKGIVKYQ